MVTRRRVNMQTVFRIALIGLAIEPGFTLTLVDLLVNMYIVTSNALYSVQVCFEQIKIFVIQWMLLQAI